MTKTHIGSRIVRCGAIVAAALTATACARSASHLLPPESSLLDGAGVATGDAGDAALGGHDAADRFGAFSPINTRGASLMSFGDVDISGWSNLNQYDFLFEDVPLLASDSGSFASSLGAVVKQPGVSLLYFNSWAIGSAYIENVDYSQARTSGWLALDSSGQPIGTYGLAASAEALALVDNPSYQQQVIANAKQTAANFPGLKGFLIDNILPDYTSELTGHSFGSYPAVAYPSVTAWRTAILGFVTNVGGALRQAGFFVVVNMTGYTTESGYDEGTFERSWLQQIAGTGGVDGVLLETWMQDPNNLATLRTNESAYPGWFSNWIELTTVANAQRVQFFPDQQGSSMDLASMRYGKAAFLLNWDGVHGAVAYAVSPAYDSMTDPWNTAWTSDIGAPTAAKVLVSSAGVWTRTFTGGWIAVNATTSAQSVTMNGVSYPVPATDAIIHSGP